jgi:hypothetical protein
MKMNKKVLALGACGILGIGGALGAYSLYTGVSDKKVNTFDIQAGTSGSVVGEIEEPNWNPDDATDLQPGATVAKDPKFTSSADYDAWVIMRVDIPQADIEVGGDGTGATTAQTPVYIVSTSGNTAASSDAGELGTIGDGWKFLDSTTANGVVSYFYGYEKGTIATGESTTALFDSFKVKNITKLEDHFNGSIDVSANIVQKEGNDDIDAAWAAVKGSNWVAATVKADENGG